MSRFSSVIAVFFALALFILNVDGCSRRRNNRFPGVVIGRTPLNPSVRAPTGTFTVVTRKPTNPPTFAATASPTEKPTSMPTSEPTPVPTPPPPPSAILGFQPTPDKGTVVQMQRPRCVKTSEWKRKEGGNGQATDVKEFWTYTCSFNVYVTVDLGTINEPTPCACGVKLENPAPASQVFGGGNQTTQIDYVRLVVFDEVTRKVVGEIENFPFAPSKNLTDILANQTGNPTPDYSHIIAGFAGVAMPFANRPALLDQTKPGQQSNVPALCFQVTQTYTTDYQWPEPPPPVLEQAPNLFMSACIPWDRTKPLNYKRDTPQVLPKVESLFWKEFLVFARPSSGVKNRYITSFYNTNANDCGSEGGVASFDRQFTSEISTVKDGNAGVFTWKRTYTDVFVIAGAPKSFSQINNYLSDGYYKISWTQKYTLDLQGNFADGLLDAALLGNDHAACNGYCGKGTMLCTRLPSWKAQKSGSRLENEGGNDLYLFPVPNDGSIDCEPAFKRCAEEKTFIAFQNFGGAARDFSKIRGSHLFTGPRDLFCTSVESPVLDTLEFKPLQAGAQIKKRGEESFAEFSVTKRSTLNTPQSNLVKIDGTNKMLVNGNPPQANLPQPSEIIIRPGTGSASIDQKPGGDHPVELFPESYVAPMSVRQDESGCGSFQGNGLDDFCVASQLNSRPPCLPGQRGCSCRSSSFGSPCDIGLDCSSTGFCLRSDCPVKSAGCSCDAQNSCSAGLTCTNSKCVYSKANEGQAGYLCNAKEECLGGAQCEGGVCIVAANADGKAGGYCNSQIACPPGFSCDKDLSMCLTTQYCLPGSGGCNCAAGKRCASGFECNGDGQCVQYSCTEGTIGCPCGSGCAGKLVCRGKKVDGSDKVCVGEVNCKGNQLARCESYCGAGNVKTCPLCDYQTPVCHVASASSVVASVAVLAVAVIALMF